MPSVSGKQHRAMEAAEHGESTLGIPPNVGKEFVDADKSSGKSFRGAMQRHGLAKGDGSHKRHPVTSHYTLGKEGHQFRSRT